jgi:hypothetical protein
VIAVEAQSLSVDVQEDFVVARDRFERA